MKSQEEISIQARAEQVRGKLQEFAAELRVVDDELEGLAPQRMHHQLLDQACGSLEKLGELGAASLFWGGLVEPARTAEHLGEVRARVSSFQATLGKIDGRRQAILVNIGREEESLEILGEDLYHAREEEERRKLEWVVEREISAVPRRVQEMAWARGGEDDWRFRKSLAASLAISLLFGALLPMIDLPLPKPFEAADVPKRLAQLVREEKAKPLPPPPVVEEAPPEDKRQQEQKPDPKPQPVEKRDELPPEMPAYAAVEPEPQKTVEKVGILAFREKFASLAQDKAAPRLGADARFSDAEDASGEASSRSMLTSNAPGSSGGINLASLSRNVGGGGNGAGGGGSGAGMQGVQVGRATSSIASIGGGGGDRPLARGGPGLARTDEEIQIVFDRYKAAFYRLYNRELRNDPTLRGQMILRLTIEPDGRVSMCVLQSSDMDAPNLSAQVVDRVRTINFGAKEVQALTIVYPIDFLPAA
ncbi:MAG TPA: AgmX/PglI C-terminal domain-containing protein [Steroidobacteraceae bacterium]|nr:AgmX/PglI C-terminal domain-containing protein [Steroidobacteraceae bacterium]